jgi:hypothetical protein
MSRALRITLWSVGLVAVALGASLFWIESQLRPEPLGARVKGLLADAGIKGGIARVEASLDGRFSAEGVELVLADGTKIAAASLKGEADLFAIIRGTYALSRFELKALDVDLSSRRPAAAPKDAPAAAPTKTTLPPFVLGPYALTGRVKLADGTLLRFSVRGDAFDSRDSADLRAGVAWPGFIVGKQTTDPRGEISLKASFRRPLGGQGVTPEALCDDLASVRMEVTAKDASPVAAGSVGFVLDAATSPGKPGLGFTGTMSDSAGRSAVKLRGEHLAGRFSVAADLDVDPTRFGILSQQLPDVRVTGAAKGELEGARWQADVDLKAAWADLSRLSPSLPKGGRSEWRFAANARSTDDGFAVNRLTVTGHGVKIAIPQTLTWKGGLLPANADDATVAIAADDADLVALNPFLAATGVTITTGRWTGEASVSFKDGQPAVRSVRTHSLRGVTLEQAGKPLMRAIDAELPVSSADGAIALGPFRIRSGAGEIAGGTLTLRPGADGAWTALADVDVGIVELASQPNWGDLPVDKLRGIRVSAKASVERAAGKAPVVAAAEARIFRQGRNLLALKLRQPFPTEGPRPTGVIVEATARDLPLESLAAVVPGLKLSGDLTRADLVAGFSREGLFIRTEGAPLAFAGTSVSWGGKAWVKECDLAAGLDLLIGEGSTTIGFNQASLKNQNRVLAEGDIKVGLGEAGTTLRLQGDLGALAEQPFAGPLGVVTGGRYRASADRAQDGEIKVSLEVSEVGLRRSEGRITQATVTGRYAPKSDGLDAEGAFRLQAARTSAGKFTLTQRSLGGKNDWQAKVTVDNIDVDDVLSLLPKTDDPVVETPPVPPAPDKTPFWAGHTGALDLTIGTAKAYGIKAENVVLRADAQDNGLRLTQLTGRLAEGALNGRGQLTFQSGMSNGPYALAGNVSLTQFNFGEVAQAVPAVKDFLQGKGDATVSVAGMSGTAGELLGRLQVDAQLTSRGGVIRAFGDKNSSMSLSANKAGDIGETLGGLALIAGALTKNQQQGGQIARIGAAMTAAAKLQKAVAEFAYTSATIKVSRLASGSIKLETADIRNATLQLSAKGGINVDPAAGFADWPMAFTTQMRGSGEFAEYFQVLGFGAGPSPADGFTEGPGVNVTGSLNQIRTDLAEKLQAAVDRTRNAPSAAPAGQTPQPVPGGQAAPPRRLNPLGDLLNGLGR